MTIIMIAHRLQTILTADNLLYLESPTSVIGASKGTPEYDQIIERLKRTNYAHQADDLDEEDQESVESDDDDEEDDKRSASALSYNSKHSESMRMDKAARRESRAIAREMKRNSKLTDKAKAAMKAQ